MPQQQQQENENVPGVFFSPNFMIIVLFVSLFQFAFFLGNGGTAVKSVMHRAVNDTILPGCVNSNAGRSNYIRVPQSEMLETEEPQRSESQTEVPAESPVVNQETKVIKRNVSTTEVNITTTAATSSDFYYKEYVPPSNDANKFEGGVTARAFTPWPVEAPLPCYLAEGSDDDTWNKNVQNTPTDKGFLFLKTYKTGSSTASGVNIRLSRNIAKRQVANETLKLKNANDFAICEGRFNHGWAVSLFPNRLPNQSFAWTSVRDPSSRLVSMFFHFDVSRHKKEPSDAQFKNMIRNKQGHALLVRDHYLNVLLRDEYIYDISDPAETINNILQDYNFIAITERMDESLVVLSMILGIPLSDVLYLKAKGHGGFDDAGGDAGDSCTYIWPSFVSEGMKEFMQTDEYQDIVHWDRVLYEAANRSLDLTIDKLGRRKVEENLIKYLEAKAAIAEKCEGTTRFPCSHGGSKNYQSDCLWKDSACGMDCMDEVALELGL